MSHHAQQLPPRSTHIFVSVRPSSFVHMFDMTESHNHHPRHIKICTSCHPPEALKNALLSWKHDQSFQRTRFCDCGKQLLLCEEVDPYQASFSRAQRVRFCIACSSHEAGLSLSWTGSKGRYDQHSDCAHSHGATRQFVDQGEVKRFKVRRSMVRRTSGNVIGGKDSLDGFNPSQSTKGDASTHWR